MKFRVTMKDPDTLHDAIREAVGAGSDLAGLPLDERRALVEIRVGKVNELCGEWFEYSEYITVEIDTDAKTCIVVPTRGVS